MNIEKLKAFRDKLALLSPESCDMSIWYKREGMESFAGPGDTDELEYLKTINQHRCGSVGCMGGWAETFHIFETGKYKDGGDVLGLNWGEENHLFYDFPNNQPEEGWQAWMLARLDTCIEAEEIVPLVVRVVKADSEPEPENEEVDYEPCDEDCAICHTYGDNE